MGFHGAGPPAERTLHAYALRITYTACRESRHLRHEAGRSTCRLGLAAHPSRP
jgi:hypothetical protein